MATIANIYVDESFEARTQTVSSSGVLQSADVTYLVRTDQPGEVVGEDEALEVVRNYAPKTLGTLSRNTISISERLAPHLLKVVVAYVSSDYSYSYGGDDEEEDSSAYTGTGNAASTDFSGEISSGTEHVNYGTILESFGDVPPNVEGAFGLDEEGNVTGIDRECAFCSFSETHTFSKNKFNSSFLSKLLELKDHVNSSSFRGFSAGEVKFSGVSFQRQGSGNSRKYVVTYRFDVRKNEGAVVVNGVKIPAKYGWDAVCPYNRSCLVDKSGEKRKTTQMTGGWIARVYPFASFTSLGIGTGSF
jgi:hypothetical protein